MSYSYTLSETFSITEARHIASRVAGDLRLMSSYYGRPYHTEIEDYLEEIAQLLSEGYLATFEIGFKRNGGRLFTLYYEVLADGSLSDLRAGGVPAGIDISGASFFSYLTHSEKWDQLAPGVRDAFAATLPVQRTPGPEPIDGNGYWVRNDRSYAAGGAGLRRGQFVPV